MNIIFNMISWFSFDMENYEINKLKYAIETKNLNIITHVGVWEGFFNDNLRALAY